MEWNVEIVRADDPDMRVAFMTSGPEAEKNARLIVSAVAALTASPAGDDPKALDAAAYKVGDFVRVIGRDECSIPHDLAIGSVHQIVEIYEDGSGADLGDWSCRFHEIEPAARSYSTEAVEREVERLREATETAAIDLECIATAIRHGYEAQAAVDAEMSASRLRAALAPSLPGKEVAS